MAYGTVKVDSIIFTNGGSDQTVTVSGIVQSISGNITATGTIQGATIIGTSTVSGATVTGDSGQYGNLTSISGVYTTQLSGTTITGDTIQAFTVTGVSGVYTTQLSGATITGDTGNYSELTAISGVFTTQISGVTITGDIGQYTTLTGISGVFTTAISGATITGDAGNYSNLTAISGVFTTQISGTTVTGDAGSFATVTGGVATITSGVFALGEEALPSISFSSDPNTGIYSPGADQVALSTNGTGRLFVDASGNVGIGVSPSASLEVNGEARFTRSGVASQYVGIIGDGTDTRIVAEGSSKNLTIKNNSTTSSAIIFDQAVASSYIFNQAGTERLRITSTGELKHLGGGSEGSPAVYFAGSAPSNSLYVEATTGHVGIGTSSPARTLDVRGSAVFNDGTVQATIWPQVATNVAGFGTNNNYPVALVTNGSQRLHVTETGLVGIGSTAPGTFDVRGAKLTLADSTSDGIGIKGRKDSLDRWYVGYNSNDHLEINQIRNNQIAFKTNNTEVARIDSSGRLLVGTSLTSGNVAGNDKLAVVIAGESTQGGISVTDYAGVSSTVGSYAAVRLQRSYGATDGSFTALPAGSWGLGRIEFNGSNGVGFGTGATIEGFCDDLAWGSGDHPGRLVFSVTADGASSPTERMRIDSAGNFYVNKTTTSLDSDDGVRISSSGRLDVVSESTSCVYVSRPTTDGTLITFRHAGDDEGSISVSGTTVSYNGAHLSRWSQLPGGAERTEILRGTVLSNIDEMCEWGDEDNEQLNRMKVSDVEGDKNVSGVFQAWDDGDDTYTNDFYCAMTGDFIIRIGAGVTVERGDLLMSAGDGTAKPQDDDIIRSKTIAKVTSTNVTCTYEDGSYCVPCVLMAC